MKTPCMIDGGSSIYGVPFQFREGQEWCLLLISGSTLIPNPEAIG